MKVRDLHDFANQQRAPHFLQDLQDGFVEDHMVVLYLAQVGNEFVYLLFAYLQTMVQLLIHHLTQLELL